MAGKPTAFIDNTAVIDRAVEMDKSTEQFYSGVNVGGTAPGIGINIDGGAISNTSEKWTLLDQRGNPRVPQESQHLGGNGLADGIEGPDGFAIQVAINSASGDGRATSDGEAQLPDVPTGWEAASGFDLDLTVGQTGPNDYGYSSGVAGTLVPDVVNGVVVDSIAGNSSSGLVTVTTVGNAPIYGNSAILLSVQGAPDNPYQIEPLAPGLGFYQSVHASLATHLFNNNGNTLGTTIGEAQ